MGKQRFLSSKSWGKIGKKASGGNIFLRKNTAFKFVTKSFDEKKFSLLARKLFLEKKGCTFEWCLVLSQKYTKSLGGKNLALCNGFVPSKVEVFI